MIIGRVRDGFPRIALMLPGKSGPIRVEFVLDTGFDGELAVPASILNRVDATHVSNRAVQLADGTRRYMPHYELETVWMDEERTIELIALEGRPLLGSLLLSETDVNLEMTEGGEVSVERL